ncbi:MAG: sulfotransferase [Pseudomonadota bacterium]
MSARDPKTMGAVDLSDKMCFYCIGAQKTGSSWLHQYLGQLPDVYTPPVKELHYFDTRHLARLNGRAHSGWLAAQASKLSRRVLVLTERLGQAEDETLKAEIAEELKCRAKLLEALHVPEAYREILTGNLGEATVFGETTPAYALLDRKAFEEMAGLFPNTRFIFVMRDPVDRLWSQMRMRTQRREVAGLSDHEAEARAVARFEEALTKRDGWARSDYKHTIEQLSGVVPDGDVLFLFYETMFTEDVIRQVCDFLGVSYQPARFSEKVHGGRAQPLPADLASRARAVMADVYDFIEGRFGDAVPTSWRQA